MLKSLLPNAVKVNITIDDIRLRSNLSFHKTIGFSKKTVYTILGFTQFHSKALYDSNEFVYLISGSNKGDEPVKSTGIEKLI